MRDPLRFTPPAARYPRVKALAGAAAAVLAGVAVGGVAGVLWLVLL